MFGKLIALCIISILTSPLVSAQSQCRVCMPNYAKCMNETSYQLCYEMTTLAPIDEEVYTCRNNEYCTDSENICEPYPDGVNIKAVCAGQGEGQDPSSACSSCTGKANGQFICVSATQFAVCRDEVATSPLSCPSDQLCSEQLVTENNLKKVCAPQAVLDYFDAKVTCDSEDLVTKSTTKAPPAASTTPMDTASACQASGNNRPYYQIKHPSDCQAYIYCERNGNSYISMVMRCKTGMFYSVDNNKCIRAPQCPQKQPASN